MQLPFGEDGTKSLSAGCYVHVSSAREQMNRADGQDLDTKAACLIAELRLTARVDNMAGEERGGGWRRKRRVGLGIAVTRPQAHVNYRDSHDVTSVARLELIAVIRGG